jgi:hypothetical protein
LLALRWIRFDEHHIFTAFGSFERGGHAADTTTYD